MDGGCCFPWSWLVDKIVLWKHLCPKGLFLQKRKANTTTTTPLPKELVLEILSRLPTTSVIRFRLVSKEWCLLTSTQSFIEMHENNQPTLESSFVVQYFDRKRTVPRFQLKTLFINEKATDRNKKFQMVREYIDLIHTRDPPEKYYVIDLLSSYKGFLLFTAKTDWPDGETALIFYNPVTKEQLTVTGPPSRYVYCGFFFHSPTKEYRILYQVFDYDDHNKDVTTVRFELLGLQTRSLRKIYVNKSFSANYYPDLSTPAVISNGALHWMVSEAHHKKVFGGAAVPSCSETILSFGMESEEFCLMPHPRLYSGRHDCVSLKRTGHKMNLLEMDGGILCLCDGYRLLELDIFVMENYEKWAWVQKYVFPFHAYPDFKLRVDDQRLKALQIHQGELLLYYRPSDEYNVEYLLYPLNQEEEEEEEEEEPDDASYRFIKWLSFGSKNESKNESKDLEEEFECLDDDNLVFKKKKTKKKTKKMMMMKKKKKKKEEEEEKKHFKVVIDQLLLEENDKLDDDQIIRRIVIKHPGSLHKSIYHKEVPSASASASVGNIVVLTPSIASLQQWHQSSSSSSSSSSTTTTAGTGNGGGGGRNYILSLFYDKALTEYDVQARKWGVFLNDSSSCSY